MAVDPSAAPPAMWLPFVINYGVIAASILLLAALAYARVPPFRTWLAQPINKFWLVWIIFVVASGGMIAMMIFPGADGQMGWGMLKFDGAFEGEVWKVANEVNTQIIVLCFTVAALVNHPPTITELYLAVFHPEMVQEVFPRALTPRERKTFLLFANANPTFMYPLTFSTWMLSADVRPFLYTAVFLPLSLGSGAAAGIYLALKQRKGEAAPI